jgi:hypothetical protein
VRIQPPLVITREQIDRALAVFASALAHKAEANLSEASRQNDLPWERVAVAIES